MSGSIYLAYLNGYEPAWSETVAAAVAETLAMPVGRLDLALDLGPTFAPERGQYHATLILASLLRYLPRESAKILGITSVDLFIPVLTFVFGQSQLNGPGAVISTYRLCPTFYGLPPDRVRVTERAIKEGVHELGHAFGLVHCANYECVMHSSSHIDEVDLKGWALCDACRTQQRAAVSGRVRA